MGESRMKALTATVVVWLLGVGAAQAASTLSLPDDASGAPGGTVQVPLSAAPADGILGIDLTVNFTNSVIHVVNVTTTPRSASFTLTFNNSTPGVVYISLFGTAPMSGTGPIVNLHVQAVGTAGQSSPLDITRGEINEGGIPSILDDGLFQICTATDTDGDGTLNCTDADDDGDGVADGQDCPPLDNTASTPPIEVGVLTVTGAAPTTLTWTPQGAGGFRYDVASGSTSSLRPGGVSAAACLLNDRTVSNGTDSRPKPAAGQGYYYIVRAQNACGSGPYGFNSSGSPEVPS